MILIKKKRKLFADEHLHKAHESIRALMAPVLERARRNDCVLFLQTQCKFFSPEKLEAEWKQGRYLWGPSWWRLVPRTLINPALLEEASA